MGGGRLEHLERDQQMTSVHSKVTTVVYLGSLAKRKMQSVRSLRDLDVDSLLRFPYATKAGGFSKAGQSAG